MMKSYPLICNNCDTKKLITERKIYEVEISEIILDKTESKYPHIRGDYRHLQICEHCLINSDINKLLIKHNREFK